MIREMKHTCILVIVALIFMLGLTGAAVYGVAGDVVLDFESATPGNFTTMEEDEYNINFVGYGNYPMIGVDGGGNHFLRDSLLDWYGAEVIITPKSGENFQFRSLDYNNILDPQGLHAMAVTVIYASDSSWHTFEFYPTSSSYATLTSDALGITGIDLKVLRVNLVSMTADYTVDNIVLSDVTPPVITEIDGDAYDGTDPMYLGYIATGFDKSVSYEATDYGSGFAGGNLLTGDFDIPTDLPSLDMLSETLSVEDLAGNQSSVTFEYKVINLDDMIQLLAPVANKSEFKKNSNIPIKLQMMVDTNDDGILEPQQMSAEDLTFSLELWFGDEQIEPTRTNHVGELGATEFKLGGPDYDTYQFNLNTKGLETGEYTLKIYIMDKAGMDEGLVGEVIFTIK